MRWWLLLTLTAVVVVRSNETNRDACYRMKNTLWSTEANECVCRTGWEGPYCSHAWCGGDLIGLWDTVTKRCLCAAGYTGAICDQCVGEMQGRVAFYCCRTLDTPPSPWLLTMLTLDTYEAMGIRAQPKWQCQPMGGNKLGCACENRVEASSWKQQRAFMDISEEREFWSRHRTNWLTHGALDRAMHPLAWSSAQAAVVGAAISDLIWAEAPPPPHVVQTADNVVLPVEDEEEPASDTVQRKTFALWISILTVLVAVCTFTVFALIYLLAQKKNISPESNSSVASDMKTYRAPVFHHRKMNSRKPMV